MQPIYKNRNTQADKDKAVRKLNSEMGKTDRLQFFAYFGFFPPCSWLKNQQNKQQQATDQFVTLPLGDSKELQHADNGLQSWL